MAGYFNDTYKHIIMLISISQLKLVNKFGNLNSTVKWGDFAMLSNATFGLLLITIYSPSGMPNKAIFDYQKTKGLGEGDELSNCFKGLPW